MQKQCCARFRQPRLIRRLALVLFLLLPACGGTNRPTVHISPPPPHQRRTMVNTDLNPYGANVFLGQEVEEAKRARTLTMIEAAHIGWITQEFSWEDIEEPRKGQFYDTRYNKSTWFKWDNIVSLAEKHHLNIIARLDRPPSWARSDKADPEAPPARFQDYADFVSIFIKHYKGRIHYIQIWNEPNIYPEWGSNAAPNPAQYVDLLKVAYNAAKKADSNVFVSAAPLAETKEISERNISELIYLQQMYDAGAKPFFDIMTANAYGFNHPPSDPPDTQVLNFQRVTLVHDIMVKNGDVDKPIWFNEFGWNASPTDNTVDPKTELWSHVSLDQQAKYTVAAIRLARKQWNWVGVTNIWYFRQPGNRYPPTDSSYYFQMVTPDFVPEPIYYAVRDLAGEEVIAGAGYFEEENAAVLHDNTWHQFSNSEASGHTYLITNEINSTVIFTFFGSSVDLIARKEPVGGVLYVTIDDKADNANLLPATGSHRFIDLYAATTTWQNRIPLARQLSNGKHVVVLTVADQKNRDATGNVANVDAFVVDGSTS